MDELDKKNYSMIYIRKSRNFKFKCEYVIKNTFNNNAKKSKNSMKQILSTT